MQPRHADDWYDAEEPTRHAFVAELQRVRRRVRVRPVRVVLLAALITGAIGYKVSTREKMVEAEVVLALTEGELSVDQDSLPADQLKEYVTAVLIPDQRRLELIETHNLFRLRHRLGDQYALTELESQIEIEVWRNSFAYYDTTIRNVEKSARIGITFFDTDPDRAIAVAQGLAQIAIETHIARKQRMAEQVSNEVTRLRSGFQRQVESLEDNLVAKRSDLAIAKLHSDAKASATLSVDIAALEYELKRAQEQLSKLVGTSDEVADQASMAGLGTTLEIVEQRRPGRPAHAQFVFIMVMVVVGTFALIGSAMIVGAFDTRVHDTDDVERLGLPILGHVPGFAGDHVGSMDRRGAGRRRVPSFLRWRLLR
ncbi:MAG: hypothetical protein AB7O24_25565 [Kofleriaceae bacterium]